MDEHERRCVMKQGEIKVNGNLITDCYFFITFDGEIAVHK